MNAATQKQVAASENTHHDRILGTCMHAQPYGVCIYEQFLRFVQRRAGRTKKHISRNMQPYHRRVRRTGGHAMRFIVDLPAECIIRLQIGWRISRSHKADAVITKVTDFSDVYPDHESAALAHVNVKVAFNVNEINENSVFRARVQEFTSYRPPSECTANHATG